MMHLMRAIQEYKAVVAVFGAMVAGYLAGLIVFLG